MVMYKGTAYYFISQFRQVVEIAPTKHGAGSFEVHESLISRI